MNSRKVQLEALDRLLTIMDELREQCPWDKKQTLESLRHLTIEETYELGEAILENDLEEVKKELGDLLLHIIFYAKIGSETNDFDIADVATSISENDIRIAFANLPQIGHGFWDVMNGPGHADWRVMTVEEKASVPRLGMHVQLMLLPPSEVL